MKFWDKKEATLLFQKLPFYNVLIEKPRIKHLSTQTCYMRFSSMMNQVL